jgi:hypothetical protein
MTPRPKAATKTSNRSGLLFTRYPLDNRGSNLSGLNTHTPTHMKTIVFLIMTLFYKLEES